MGIFDLFKPNVKKMESKKDVEGLIKVLKYKKDCYLRENAAKVLGEIGNAKATEPLIQALNDEDRDVRENAAIALGKIKDDRAVMPLLAILEDKYWNVITSALEALGEIKDSRAVGPLIDFLGMHRGWSVREVVSNALKKIEPNWTNSKAAKEAADKFLSLLKIQPQPYFRRSLIEALGEIKDPGAVEPLIVALKDKDRDVQTSAIEALKNIGKPTVIPLIAVLGDKDSRGNVSEALGKIKDPAAIIPLISACVDEFFLTKQEIILNALERIDSNWANRGEVKHDIPFFITMLKEEKSIGAAKMLGKIKDPQAVEPLIDILNEDKENLYSYCIKAPPIAETLGEIGATVSGALKARIILALLRISGEDRYTTEAINAANTALWKLGEYPIGVIGVRKK